MLRIELEYNSRGYLLLPGEIAREYFPNDVLVLLVKGGEVWLLPTRGPVAGGLLLKQRNLEGDRSLLAAPYLPDDVAPGLWPGFWDDRAGALRLVFHQPALAVKAVVEPEQGRWAVYLELAFASTEEPVRVERRRIADYESADRAAVVASWMEKAADRDAPSANLGF